MLDSLIKTKVSYVTSFTTVIPLKNTLGKWQLQSLSVKILEMIYGDNICLLMITQGLVFVFLCAFHYGFFAASFGEKFHKHYS